MNNTLKLVIVGASSIAGAAVLYFTGKKLFTKKSTTSNTTGTV